MPRLSNADREVRDNKILALWKAGKSQNQLALEFEVSPSIINKLCKGVPQDNVNIVNAQVSINTLLHDKSEYEVNAIHNEVEERTRHLIFFKNSALRNQQLANAQINELTKIQDLESHSRLTKNNKDTVLGKDLDTQINIQNNVNTLEWDLVSNG